MVREQDGYEYEPNSLPSSSLTSHRRISQTHSPSLTFGHFKHLLNGLKHWIGADDEGTQKVDYLHRYCHHHYARYAHTQEDIAVHRVAYLDVPN